MVLDGIVGATRQALGNLSPLVPEQLLCLIDDPLFFFGPWVLLDGWIEVIEPSRAALLTGAGDANVFFIQLD